MKTPASAARPVFAASGCFMSIARAIRVFRLCGPVTAFALFVLGLGPITACHAQSCRILHHFAGGANDGGTPYGSLIRSGTTLFGMTHAGGSQNTGTIFRINSDGTGFQVLHSFASATTDGVQPYGSLMKSGWFLYGMATSVDTAGGGTVFRIAIDGSGFEVLHRFTDAEGKWPWAALIEVDSVLYGMATYGGDLTGTEGNGNGSIFRMNPDGSGFAVLRRFAGIATDGGSPHGSFTRIGAAFYGLTARDGGGVFRINADGSDYRVLRRFTSGALGSDATLATDGVSLFGSAFSGPRGDTGYLFRVDTDGTGFRELHRFAGGSEGFIPSGSLLRAGSTLYGMTSGIAAPTYGVVFQLRTDGTGYQVLHRFAGGPADGAEPYGDLILDGATLYGMTHLGGSENLGVIFALDLPAAPVAFASNGQQINQAVANGLALGDFNADGSLDACVGNDDGTRVYFGDGHGRFTDSSQALTGPMPAAGDVDGDGALDLLIATTVWRNDGQGRFTAQTGAVQTTESGGITGKLADLDGDGDLDVFATINYNGCRIYLNDGQGRFLDSGQRLGDTIIGTGQLAQIALGDVDGNGTIDAITTGWRWNGSVACPNRVWLNDGAGVFRDNGQALEEGNSHVHGLALGDLNGDDRPDLVLGLQDFNRSGRVYLNDGAGRFVAGANLALTRGEELALADFDGDGALDVFAGSSTSGSSRVWLNDGTGTFRNSGLSFLPGYWNWAVATGDFNRDGKPDVFVGNSQLSPNTGQGAPAQIWLNESLAPARPRSQALAVGTTLTLGAAPDVTTQWHHNGSPIPGASAPTLVVPRFRPALAGIYSATAPDATNVGEATVIGVASQAKVIGTGVELDTRDIRHPNGNYYDQVGVNGSALTLRADAGQATRASFIDLDNDIVQVEFAGAGTLTLLLDGASAPAEPVNYHQPGVLYVRGHAAIVIAGADETTNVSVFTVGRATAFDRTGGYDITLPISAANDPAHNGSPLFTGHDATAYDGFADLAFIAIESPTGRFGGVRTANASYFATRGLTGIYAPGVAFAGPVFVHDIDAADAATPVLLVGATSDARITGGTLRQDNGRAVQVSGITQLRFTAGSSSHGTLFNAQNHQARLEQNGVDVTTRIVVNSP